MRLTRLPVLVAFTLPALLIAATPDVPGDGGGEWVPVPAQSLAVAAGSALDFSGLAAANPGDGPVVVRNGRLVFDRSGAPARFNCAMVNAVERHSTFPTHDEADRIAVQLRRHGYTLVRQQFIDQRLTRRATRDLEVDPEALDRFFYFQAALKRNGLSLMLDIVSGNGTGIRGQAWGPSNADDLRVRMHFDPAARALWLRWVDQVFARTNPYTGRSTLADPALAFVSGANENGIAFGRSDAQPFPTGFGAYFDRWVRARLPTPARLAAAIPDLSAAERSGAAPVALPRNWRGSDARTGLLLRYVADLEVGTNRWMSERLAERGFRGPNLTNNDWNAAMTGETRSRLPVVDVHAYGGEVSSFTPGSRFQLIDATSDGGLALWTLNAGQRWLDRPMVSTEYSSPYPNPTRYETGLLFPAIAAFQQYGLICRMAFSSVEPAIPAPGKGVIPLMSYTVGLDPAERAAETLATMLFHRGDVAPARRTVAGVLGGADFDRPGAAFLPAGIKRATLLARFGLVTPERAGSLPSDVLLLSASDGADSYGARLLARVRRILRGGVDAQTEQLVAALRANGTLGPSNRTDATRGIFQSDTGELTIDQQQQRITVVTPRTEAASVTGATTGIALGRMRIERIDGGALLGATSLDGAPVATSRRLLLVMAGDVRNQGMQLDGAGQLRQFRSWGSLPMAMRRITAAVTLRTGARRTGRFSVLALDGTPMAGRAVTTDGDGSLRLALDTVAVPGRPTTFFLLEFDR
ncbi:hypothetical protein [Sphingomonas sp. VNH70]|uniref:hypothetical protein n=1 Tax=Sphingomonas silueang TaxID=3156617 RepID=UPI0032B565A3